MQVRYEKNLGAWARRPRSACVTHPSPGGDWPRAQQDSESATLCKESVRFGGGERAEGQQQAASTLTNGAGRFDVQLTADATVSAPSAWHICALALAGLLRVGLQTSSTAHAAPRGLRASSVTPWARRAPSSIVDTLRGRTGRRNRVQHNEHIPSAVPDPAFAVLPHGPSANTSTWTRSQKSPRRKSKGSANESVASTMGSVLSGPTAGCKWRWTLDDGRIWEKGASKMTRSREADKMRPRTKLRDREGRVNAH
ncbi:hypothetical protein B0H14DRAFT_2564296 [Mycena olivaceomarginata]|nr:hypothetical protein B0H14DRAFT_2564296 [Mycena olivaceomarginata]